MSLEAAVLENTAVLRELIAALTNGQPVTTKSTDKAFPESTTDERTAKEVSDQIKADTAKAKADAAAAKKAKEEAEAAAATQEPKDDGAAAISLQDVIDVTLALGKAGKRAQLVELLGEFNVAKSSLLDESDYSAFHAKATELLEG